MKNLIKHKLPLAALGWIALQATQVTYGQNTPRNVLFIAYDDLRPDLNCYGNNQIISPNIDALAKRGVLFSNHFVQVATCGASRYCLMTGKYPKDIKSLSNTVFGVIKESRKQGTTVRANEPGTIITMPDLYKINGYTTVAVGKVSHLADKGDMPGSWDKEFSYLSTSKFPEQKIETGNIKERLTAKMIDAHDTAFTDGLVTQRAILELQRLKAEGKPFFMGVGFHLPHLPFYAPEKYWNLYDRSKIKPADYADTPVNCKREISLHNNFEMLGQYTQLDAPDAATEARILRHGYYACISYVDAMTGLIIKELDRLGLRENTIIVLWGDNGFHLGEYGIWGKHTCFDYGLKTPLIIVDPQNEKQGTVVKSLVETIDIFPTLADLCGLDNSERSDGKSLVPLLQKPSGAVKKFVRGYLPEGEWRQGTEPLGFTVRTPKYRLVRWYDRKGQIPLDYIELYDHARNPGETVNISSAKPAKVRRLSRLIDYSLVNNQVN